MLWPSCRCSPWRGCVTRRHFHLASLSLGRQAALGDHGWSRASPPLLLSGLKHRQKKPGFAGWAERLCHHPASASPNRAGPSLYWRSAVQDWESGCVSVWKSGTMGCSEWHCQTQQKNKIREIKVFIVVVFFLFFHVADFVRVIAVWWYRSCCLPSCRVSFRMICEPGSKPHSLL